MKPLLEIKIKCAAIAMLCATSTALAADLTWSGAGSWNSPANWNDPGNWNPHQVPTAADHVVVTNGAVVMPPDAAFAIMDWSGTDGRITGSLTVASNAVLNILGSGFPILYPGTLTNFGTVTMSSGAWLEVRDCVIRNFGLWDIKGDASADSFGTPITFENWGVVRKSVGSGAARLGDISYDHQIIFNNMGTVEAQSGTISFFGGGQIGGNYQTTNGTQVTFNAGNFVVSDATIGGAGSVRFQDGGLTLLADVVPGLSLAGGALYLGPGFQGGSITNLSLNSMTLFGDYSVTGTFSCDANVSGNLSVVAQASMNWPGGRINGSLTVASNAVLNIMGPGYPYLFPATLTNFGTVVMASGAWLEARGSVIQNFGLWDIQGDLAMTSVAGPITFKNAGRLRKSAGSGTAVVGQGCCPFDNNINFENTGTVESQSGTLAFYGNYSGAPSASFAISLGGSAQGNGCGHIHFNSPLTMSGTFSVSTRNGFVPVSSNTFDVLSYPSATGAFTCFSGLDLGGGLLLVPQFSETGLSLLATTYATNSSLPELFITRAPGSVLVTWPQGFPDWVLMSTTNLHPAGWSPFPLQCDSLATVPTSEPARFFQLRKTN